MSNPFRGKMFKRRRFPEGTLASHRLDKASPLEKDSYVVITSGAFRGAVAKVLGHKNGKYQIDVKTIGPRRWIDQKRRLDLAPVSKERADIEIEIAEKARRDIAKGIPRFVPHMVINTSGPLNLDPEFQKYRRAK